MAKKNQPKRGRPRSIETGLDTLVKLAELGSATVKELDTSNNALYYLERQHKVVQRVKGQSRRVVNAEGKATQGRPQSVWRLTSTGRSRVKRAQKVSAESAA